MHRRAHLLRARFAFTVPKQRARSTLHRLTLDPNSSPRVRSPCPCAPLAPLAPPPGMMFLTRSFYSACRVAALSSLPPYAPRAYRVRDEGDDLEAPPLEFLFPSPRGLVYHPPAVPALHSPPRAVSTDQVGYPISYAAYRFRSRCVLAGAAHLYYSDGERAGHGTWVSPGAGAADSALSALSPPFLYSSLPASFSRQTPSSATPPLPTLPSRRPRHPLSPPLQSRTVRSGCRLVHCTTMTLDCSPPPSLSVLQCPPMSCFCTLGRHPRKQTRFFRSGVWRTLDESEIRGRARRGRGRGGGAKRRRDEGGRRRE
ncbi:hypothetical protein B0H14DRAFT_382925 [Mycena olivaceomarginata]|nr:hypothetical protein B0H14DRAFT_382925 [Mycena olivaceomarginata]